jgi:putative ABC transport system permease protein
MRSTDIIQFTQRALRFHRLRSVLTALGIAIGVAAVVLLTSMGEGLNQYMVAEFAQFGTNNLRIAPGRAETMGFSPGILNSTRPLTVEDAQAVSRLPYVVAVSPSQLGVVEVEANDRVRVTTVLGSSPGAQAFISMDTTEGRFLPEDDPVAPRALAVLGSTIAEELYGGNSAHESALGDHIRLGGSRFQVIGVLAPKGDVAGLNVDETVMIPVARAMELFNTPGLLEIGVRFEEGAPVEELVSSIRRLLTARHGFEDFSVTTQQQMMEVLGSVLSVLTLGVAALGSISLLVGGVGIFTIMTIAVRERTQEIGLLRSIGSTRRQIQRLFLSESVVLASMGGVLGLVAGGGVVLLLDFAIPALPVSLSMPYIIAAELVAVGIGLIAGVVPANHAAGLDPLEALRAE